MIVDTDFESERLLLASVVATTASRESIANAFSAIRDGFFESSGHRRFWAVLEAMRGARESFLDRARLIRNLRESGTLDGLGGAAEFAKSYIEGETGLNLDAYVSDVRRNFIRRQIDKETSRFLNELRTTSEPESAAAQHRAHVDAILGEISDDTSCVTFHDAAVQRLGLLEKPQDATAGKLIACGISCIDETYGGFRQGGSYVIAARPGRGKSALMKQICNFMDFRNRASLIVSLEMEPDEFAARILSERTEIDGKKFEVNDDSEVMMNRHELEAVRSTVADAKHSTIRIAAPKGRAASMESIASLARLAKLRWDIQLLAIDYLQIMAKSTSKQSDYEFVTANSKAFKSLARELGIVVLVLSQLNRGSEQGGKTRQPRLSDLRDSGSIEQDADGVIMLHQVKGSDYEMIVPKWRNDAQGLFKVELQGEFTRFVEPSIRKHANYRSEFAEYA